MKPVQFPGANVTFAKDQPEYLPLPVFYNRNDPHGPVISCWQFTWRERVKMFWTGKFYLSMLTFHQPLQPQLPMVDAPVITPAPEPTPAPAPGVH